MVLKVADRLFGAVAVSPPCDQIRYEFHCRHGLALQMDCSGKATYFVTLAARYMSPTFGVIRSRASPPLPKEFASLRSLIRDQLVPFHTAIRSSAYLEAALEEGDRALVAAAMGDIARAKGITQIARETGLGRESLYKALSPEGNPKFATVLKVVRALGLRLHATAVQS